MLYAGPPLYCLKKAFRRQWPMRIDASQRMAHAFSEVSGRALRLSWSAPVVVVAELAIEKKAALRIAFEQAHAADDLAELVFLLGLLAHEPLEE